MKKLKIWSLMMLAIMVLPTIIACSGGDDNDDSVQLTKESLVGHWECISERILKTDQILEGDKCPEMAIIFFDDGVCQFLDNDGWTGAKPHWIYGSYRLAGKNLAIDFKSHRQQNVLDYANLDYEITTFTKNKMVLQNSYASYTLKKN